MATNEYAKTLGRRLRSLRQQQGLSLQGVEAKSQGKWKAVVVGSYERGDRAVTVAKLAELADFYGVPVAEILPDTSARVRTVAPPKLVLNLEALAAIPDERVGPLHRYVASIQAQRGDYNGRILSIRQEDLRALAAIYDEAPAELAELFITWGVLNPEARGAMTE